MSDINLRPYEAAQDGHSYTFVGTVDPISGKDFVIPDSLTDELQAFLKWAMQHPGKVNQSELREIRDHWAGGKAALSAKYFPKPKGADPVLWEQNKRLLTHVNLVGTAIRTWVNAVYAEEAYRSLTGGYEELATWIASDEFASSMYAWAENKTAFGEAVAVPRWDPELEELFTWLPDPVYTIIRRDPNNKRRILGIAEVTTDRIEFVSIWGEGYITKSEYDIEEYELKLDWLPAIVGGDGKTPKVRDAVNATYACCQVMYNIRMLQKQQTKSILVRMDDLEKLTPVGGGKIKRGTDASSIDVSEKGDAKYISPDPKIKESIEVLRQQIIILATASGIPADVLDPTLTESSSSAEGSRIRAIPFIQNSKPVARDWRSDERSIIHAGQYYLAIVKKERKRYTEVRKAVIVDIGLSTVAIPMTPNEETQDTIARVSFGLTEAIDAVRRGNGTKSEKQLWLMAKKIDKRLAEQGAQSVAQRAVGGGRPTVETGSGGSVKTARKAKAA